MLFPVNGNPKWSMCSLINSEVICLLAGLKACDDMNALFLRKYLTLVLMLLKLDFPNHRAILPFTVIYSIVYYFYKSGDVCGKEARILEEICKFFLAAVENFNIQVLTLLGDSTSAFLSSLSMFNNPFILSLRDTLESHTTGLCRNRKDSENSI